MPGLGRFVKETTGPVIGSVDHVRVAPPLPCMLKSAVLLESHGVVHPDPCISEESPN